MAKGINTAGSKATTKKRRKSKNPHKRNSEAYWLYKMDNANTDLQVNKVIEQWNRYKAMSGLSPSTIKAGKEMIADVKRTL